MLPGHQTAGLFWYMLVIPHSTSDITGFLTSYLRLGDKTIS